MTWVTKEEREQIHENAAWFGMNLAEYQRTMLLGPVIEKKIERRWK